MQVADAGGAVVAPASRVIKLRVVGGAVAVRHAAFAIPGAYEVFDGGRGSAGCAADIEHGAGGGVGDHLFPDAARVVQDFPGDRTRHRAMSFEKRAVFGDAEGGADGDVQEDGGEHVAVVDAEQ